VSPLPAGTLFVVATPIGNLGDMTSRAREVLGGVDAIFAEDTRQTRKLLDLLGIQASHVLAMHEHSSAAAIEGALERLRRGERVALVSDAGTPLVSDPGAPLVRAARAEGVRVTPVPGASAVVAALSATALGDGRFRFFAFLPREGPERRDAVARCAETEETVVVYEAPHRLAVTLRELAEAMPAREAVVLRELTKLHEEQIGGTLAELAALEREWIGEIVIVLAPWNARGRTETVTDEALDARIDALYTQGERAKRISELLAAWSGRPKRELYERVVARKPR
jgi:16S rRNA (cytidine1402-2'-O)-methyltransferase